MRGVKHNLPWLLKQVIGLEPAPAPAPAARRFLPQSSAGPSEDSESESSQRDEKDLMEELATFVAKLDKVASAVYAPECLRRV